MFPSLTGNPRRLCLCAALVLTIVCAMAAGGSSAPAETLQEEYDEKQGKLSDVRESESSIADSIAEQNRAIDSMIGEVSALRQEQAADRGRARRQAGGARRGDRAAGGRQAPPRRRPGAAGEGARRSPRAARRDLRVGQPGHDQRRPRIGELVGSQRPRRLSERDPGLRRRGRRPGQGPARRSPRRGRADDRRARADQGRARRDRRQGARSRRGPRRRRGPLRRAQGSAGRAPERARRARIAVVGAQQRPRRDLRTDGQRRRPGAGDGAGAADAGPERRLHLRKPGQHPDRRPARGAGGDRSRERDRDHPLHLGRRPRLLRILRLRLLGRGQLRAARRRLPRKPARLDRPLDLGRTGPGPVDHRLRQRRPRLDDDRRPRLRHLRRRRPALAPGTGQHAEEFIARHPPGF